MLERIYKAMELGFTLVMYDCSAYPYRENISRVREMTELTHSRGITVEGELGHVGENISSDDGSINAQPEQAEEYAAETGVDALAAAIRHLQDRPELDIGRLRENMAAASVAHEAYRDGCGMTDLSLKVTGAAKQAALRKMKVFGSFGKA